MIRATRHIIHVTKWPDENHYSAYCPGHFEGKQIPDGAVGSGETISAALRSLADAIDLLNETSEDDT